MKIESLTPEQIARFPEFRDRWLRIGLATAPCDRKAIESAVDAAYDVAGLPPPKLKLWLRSPVEGAVAAAMMKDKCVRAQVGDRVGDQVWAQVGDQVRAQVWDQVGAQVGAQVWDRVGAALYGHHEANWLAFYAYFGEVLGIDVGKLRGLMDMAQCGWWWAFEGVAILTERPIALHRDERGRLHHPTQAAIEYADGFGVYAWHGTRVPSEWMRPEGRDPRLALTWENVEQRRALAEMVGWDRVLECLSPTVIDEDSDPQVGTLLRVDLPDSPGEQFLRVRCGTGRSFVLPVPASCRTALEANASTYDVSPEMIRLMEVRT